jgi:hypothetical protein
MEALREETKRAGQLNCNEYDKTEIKLWVNDEILLRKHLGIALFSKILPRLLPRPEFRETNKHK